MLNNLNKKQKIELAITAVGVIFLIFMLIASAAQRIHKRKKISTNMNTKSAPFLSQTISFGRSKLKESAIKEGWGRDPFFPGSSSIASDSNLAGLALDGILWGSDNPYAIINNDIVTVGDIVDDAMVLEINEDNVIVEQDDERYILRVSSF